jgi:hypothetical protein
MWSVNLQLSDPLLGRHLGDRSWDVPSAPRTP